MSEVIKIEPGQTEIVLLEKQAEIAKWEADKAKLPEERRFELEQRKGKLLASSDIIPKHFQGKLSNCIVAMELAERMGFHPLMVMQNCAIINGKPSWSAQFLIGLINHSGQFARLHYVFTGSSGNDSWGCYVRTTDKVTGEELKGPEVTIAIAKAEGWFSKDQSKWRTMPQLMLTYRAAAFFARTYCPELAMGLQTDTEIEDVEQTVRIAEPQGLMDLIPQTQGE